MTKKDDFDEHAEAYKELLAAASCVGRGFFIMVYDGQEWIFGTNTEMSKGDFLKNVEAAFDKAMKSMKDGKGKKVEDLLGEVES